MATPDPNPYANLYQPYAAGPRRAVFGQDRQEDGRLPMEDAGRQLADALLDASKDLGSQAWTANTYGQGSGGQDASISPGAANNIMDMAKGLFGGSGATGSLYGDTSGLTSGNPWSSSLIFDSNMASEVPSAASIEGLFGSGGGGAAGGGAGSSAGAAAGGESALASAGPWAALAALIAGNEREAKRGGYRDDSDWRYTLDLLFGKVSEQDAYNRWIPKLGDDLLGDDGDRFGMQADMGGFFDLLTGDFSNWWDNMKNEGSLARMFQGDFGSRRDDSLSKKAKERRKRD